VTGSLLAGTPTQTVQAFLDALGRHDIDVAMTVVDPRVSVIVHPLAVQGGADALRTVITDLVHAFPDLMVGVIRVIATGDVVTALINVEGTQASGYAGTINTEKHLDIDQAWRFVTAGGLINGVAVYWCQAQLYRRLGVKRYDEIAIA
jgi:predicted ester cyclase